MLKEGEVYTRLTTDTETQPEELLGERAPVAGSTHLKLSSELECFGTWVPLNHLEQSQQSWTNPSLNPSVPCLLDAGSANPSHGMLTSQCQHPGRASGP